MYFTNANLLAVGDTTYAHVLFFGIGCMTVFVSTTLVSLISCLTKSMSIASRKSLKTIPSLIMIVYRTIFGGRENA